MIDNKLFKLLRIANIYIYNKQYIYIHIRYPKLEETYFILIKLWFL